MTAEGPSPPPALFTSRGHPEAVASRTVLREGARVRSLELFFDLVFVLAFTIAYGALRLAHLALFVPASRDTCHLSRSAA